MSELKFSDIKIMDLDSSDFKEAYQSALGEMKEFHIDAASCIDERRHAARVRKRLYRTTATAFSGFCILFICGFGTVSAAGYLQNLIQVNERGFASADTLTMERSMEGDITMMADVMENEPVLIAEDTAQPQMAAESGVSAEQEKRSVEQAASATVPVKEYQSLEEFYKEEQMVFPQPGIPLGGNQEDVSVMVSGNWAMIRYDVDGKTFWTERTDYGDTQGHVSSKTFPGGVTNERTYQAGNYIYILVDSVKQSEEEALQIHAAVSVGNYEVYMDFMGFTEKEAEEILSSVDLSQYESGKKEE